MKRLIIGTIALAAVAAFAAYPAAGKTLDPATLRTLVGVSEPQLSPDGKRIAFIKTTSDFAKDRRDSQLMLLDVASGAIRSLTYDRQGLDSPRWSPSGDRLAFIANAGDGDDVESQIFVMPMDGGDAKQVTKTSNGVQEFAWRPDGRAFAYITQDDPPNKKQLDKHFDAFEVGDLDYKTESAPVPSHLWTISATGDGPKRLTSGSWSLSTSNGGGVEGPLTWSADGKRIAIQKLPNAVYGDSDDATTAVVDAKSGKVRDLPGQRPFFIGAEFAPAGDALAGAWFPHGAFNSNGYLVTTTSAGGAGSVVGGQEHNLGWYAWSTDGRALLFSNQDGPLSRLRYAPTGGAVRTIDLGTLDFPGDATVGPGASVAFVGVSPGEPGEIYYLASPGARVRQLTHSNDAIEKISLGKEYELRWTGPGGYHEDGIVTLPPGYVAGRRYPLALVVHGGPQSASELSFSALTQLIAARGIVTFAPNYRGSTNLGDAYQHAIYRDTGDGPGKDVMAGVAVLEKQGIVDPSRMCVSGWSYGGYMTTWLESHYDVWKCAMAGAALTDWVADYTISFYQKGDADFFGRGSSPWNAQGAIWRDQSPLAFVRNVKAPTLIMGDVGDPNVPIYNSYLWYHALRDEGVDVHFFAYPRNSHFPGDPVGAESVDRKWVDWLVAHLTR